MSSGSPGRIRTSDQPVNSHLGAGIMHFQGTIDFSGKREIVPGDAPNYFPPKVAKAGAFADANWSSIVTLPSGVVLNAQIIKNASGGHPRMLSSTKLIAS